MSTIVVVLIILFIFIFSLLFSKKTLVKVPASYSNFHKICPWLVLIIGDNLVCGGIILNNNTILTAAHCVYNQKTIKIFPGVVDRLRLPKYYESLKIIVHNEYDSVNLYNDIAIVKLKKNLVFSSKIHAISLPLRSPNAGEKAYVSGFGISEDGELSRWLRTFQVTITVSKYCILKYGNDYNSKLQICAGNLYNSLDFCTGDSGGPLYCKQNGVWVAVGIVSFTGKQCADGLPSVYTDTYGYNLWIQHHL